MQTCSATNEDEHAVSTAIDGPLKAKQNERRPAATENAPPEAAKGDISSI